MKKAYLVIFVFMFCATSAQQLGFPVDSFSIKVESKPIFQLPDYFFFPASENAIIEYRSPDYFKQYFFLYIINLLIVSTMLLNISRFKLKEIFKTTSSINLLKQLAIKEATRSHIYLYAYFFLFVLYFISLAAIFGKMWHLNIDLSEFIIGIMGFYLIEFIISRGTNYIFMRKEIFDTINLNNVSFLILSLPIIVIALFLMVYLPFNIGYVLSYTILVILIGIYFLKEIRNIIILNSFKIKIVSFYFFLYLCTFKILPILILIKYLGVSL